MQEIRWQAPEFNYYKKDIIWYWIVSAVGLIIAVISLWQGNLLFTFFVAVAVILVIVWGKQNPRIINFSLDEKELSIGNKKYRFDSFSGFFVDHSNVILQNKGRLGSYLKVKINSKNKAEIESLLKSRLPEIEYKESLIDALAGWIGF